MLDECKGDKFEELLANLALVVLKKIHGSQKLQQVKQENLLPLILAHRRGIQRDLEKRKELKLRAQQQHARIRAQREKAEIETQQLRSQKVPALPKNAEHIRQIVRENWIGDQVWVGTILNGVPPEDHWTTEDAVKEDTRNRSLGILSDLQARVRNQSERLAKWQACLKDLQQRQKSYPAIPKLTTKPTAAQASRFTRHQELRLEQRDHTGVSGSQSLLPQHSALLESLDREMKAGAPKSTLKNSLVFEVQQSVEHRPTQQKNAILSSTTNRTPVLQRTHTTSSIASSKATLVLEAESRAFADHEETMKPSFENDENRSAKPLVEQKKPAREAEPASAREKSLLERTRASLAHFETAKASVQRHRPSALPAHDGARPVNIAFTSKPSSDRASLMECTRQSMSMLTNVLDDSYQARPTKKPGHARSKTTVSIPTQRPRLERAWSQESLASVASKESLILDADYEAVFKSRPRIAMSPNLSPQANGGDPWLESQLEQEMNKLTINSSPEH